MQLSFRSNSVKIFYLLLATDIAFFCLHLLLRCKQLGYGGLCNKFGNQLYSINKDFGYAEFFQYIKEYWIVLLLGVLAWKNRSWLYSAWSSLFCYVLLDDAWGIHEKGGKLISDRLGLGAAFNLRRVDFGELIVSAGFGILFFTAIALAYRFGKRIERKHTQSLILMLLALAFFGIVTDMLDIAIRNPSLQPFLIFIEDGGEHLVMSAIVWLIYDIFEQKYQNLPISVNQSAIALKL
jgi:hypothetical protein